MTGEWLSITDAARRLTALGDPVDRSTLSRYLKQHAEALPLRPGGRSNLVDFGALLAHRRENIRIAAVPATEPVLPVTPSVQPGGAARKALAEAELREMDLARRRRELTPVAEVDEGARAAVALMRSAFERAVESEAATLSVRYGWEERALRLALKAFARTGVDVFHREILKRLDDLKRGDEASDFAGAERAGAAGMSLQ